MKPREITVISGKGGTGKTTLTASLIPFLENPVIADCDVDAPDLHILLDPREESRESFSGGNRARINPELCTSCGLCREACRFGAVTSAPEFRIDRRLCEGCGVCELVCPQGAVTFSPEEAGRLYSSSTAFGPLIHARLHPGEETSGKLVSLVRERARKKAEEEGRTLILADGSPGIGCSVISSITGASLALIVTEPHTAALHDLERLADLTQRLSVPAAAVINKADLSPELCERTEAFCRSRNLPVLMKIPFSGEIVRALGKRKIPSLENPVLYSRLGIQRLADHISR